MDWQYDPEGEAYTLIQGDVRCRVWHTTLGNWATVIAHRGMSTAAYNFPTPEAAQAWCAARMAELARGTLDGAL